MGKGLFFIAWPDMIPALDSSRASLEEEYIDEFGVPDTVEVSPERSPARASSVAAMALD